MPLIKVHHLDDSRSQRVLWLLEEIGLDYEVIRYQRDAKTMLAPANLRRIHPLRKAPIIEDGSLRLAETGAIVDYFVDRYGKGLDPARDGDPIGAIAIGCATEGSLMPPLLLKLVVSRLGLFGWAATVCRRPDQAASRLFGEGARQQRGSLETRSPPPTS